MKRLNFDLEALRTPVPKNGEPSGSQSLKFRSAFTLVELLVVITILLITTGLTLALVQTSTDSDRIRSSARQVQSALAGARDRAIRAGRDSDLSGLFGTKRGLRMLVDPDAVDPTKPTISSMVFIASVNDYQEGDIIVGRQDIYDNTTLGDPNPSGPADDLADNSSLLYVYGNLASRDSTTSLYVPGAAPTNWYRLKQQGLLVNGARMRLKSNGAWYTVLTSRLTASEDTLVLATEYKDDATIASPSVPAFPVWAETSGVGQYILELMPSVLPGQEPMRLSSGIVIDVSRSNFTLGSGQNYIDIMFSPQGRISGALAARGLVHFYLSDLEDVLLNRDPSDPKSGEKLISTLFTQSGNVASFPVDPTDADSDNIADDVFSFARKGAVASR